MVKGAVVVAMVACSSRPPATGTATTTGSGSASASGSGSGSASASASASGSASGVGDVQIKLQWQDVPLVARASPGRSACGTPLPASVAPTTTWGIPDAFVIVEGSPVAAPAQARIVVERCGLSPRALVGGDKLELVSQADQPMRVELAKLGASAELGKIGDDAGHAIALPITGHEVDVALDAGGVYRVSGAESTAWIVAAPAAVTDATGVAVIRGVPAGRHAITAWLPPRSGQPARTAHGEANVTGGALAEIALDLAP